MTQIATLLAILGISGLFYLYRDPELHTTKALWLPTVWLGIAASRPISQWQGRVQNKAEQLMDGSPLDRDIFVLLLFLALIVLLVRAAAATKVLRVNAPIVLFVFYCATSIAWSDFPEVAFKRWIKSLGDFVMIMIVLTEPDVSVAVKRIVARVSFVLLPVSVLFIKYYPDWGRAYDTRWEGTVFYTGVATDKNMLGMTCLIFGLGLVWSFLQLLRMEKGKRRTRSLIAVAVTLGIDLFLLATANSMTSLSCFALGSGLIVVASIPRFARKRALINIMLGGCIAFCFCVLFLDLGSVVLQALGRNPTLTGRTDLWDALRGMVVNPWLGAGFESFWLGDRLQKLWSIFWWHPNESHNGYLETYLNLGGVGIALLGVLMVTGYRNINRKLREGASLAPLWLAFFFVGVAYNFTEAAVRTVSPVWIFFMLAITAVPAAPVLDNVTEVSPVPSKKIKSAVPPREPSRIPAYSHHSTSRGNSRYS